MYEGYGSLFVCFQSTDCLRSLQNNLNIPADFTQFSKGFQQMDISKMIFLKRYSFICSFQHAKSAIFVPGAIDDAHTLYA